MRSLFGKLLLWFVFTTAVSGLGFVLSTAMNFAGQSRQPPFGLLVTLQLSEARSAYERGGSILLTETLDRFRTVLNADCFLADASGRDLSSGEDRSGLIQEIATQPRFSLLRTTVAFARRSPDNMYWYVMFVNRRSWIRWFFSIEHVWIFAIVVLLCYSFALYLTWPLRQLRHAVDRFGHGDLAARANTKRRDEMGDLGRSFNRMADRIQTLLAAERRLLLDISHELRSPLARLSLAIELARSGNDKEQALDRIQKEADRVNTLLTELLQVTRAEGDPAQRKWEAVPLDQLVKQVVEDGAVEAKARGCGIVLNAAEPVTVQGDYELIRRAVENVVRNAIRFSPRDTTVETTLRREGNSAVVEVRDYGPGVPEEALSHIFDAFYRVESDRGRSTGGVGLGLSIAKRAIELHGGSLRARNESPGLRVELRLPLQSTPVK